MAVPQFPDIPVMWHMSGVTLVVVLSLVNRCARASHITVIFITQLPGVVLHELTHLLAGLLFRAAPCGFSLLPKPNIRDNCWTLGSVVFGRITAFNAAPVALAPISLLPLAYYVYHHWFNWLPLTFPNILARYVTIFLLIYNSLPSRQDLRIACNRNSLFLYGIVAGAGWYLFWRR